MTAVLDTPAASTVRNSPALAASRRANRRAGLLGTLVMAAGLVLGLSGAGTWVLVQTNLSAESITVAEDADRFAGQDVNGPFTAWAEADIIKQHALEASAGKTYAEMDREDPARATVMNGSFLRASLFTSVVSFGIAAMAMGLGIVFLLIGYALRSLSTTERTA